MDAEKITHLVGEVASLASKASGLRHSLDEQVLPFGLAREIDTFLEEVELLQDLEVLEELADEARGSDDAEAT